MSFTRFVRAVSFVAACIVAACSESTAPVPPEIDQLLADISSAQEFGMAGLMGSTAAPPSMDGPSAANCPYNAGSHSFVCSPKTHQALTMNLSFQLLDASNAPQSAYNAATTAAIRTITDVTGPVPPTPGYPSPPGQIESHHDQTLSGLLTGTHTLNGVGTTELTYTIGQESLTLTTTQTTTALVLPERGDESPYPKSGSIAFELTTSGENDGFTSTITFNGTSIATITTTVSGVTQTCTVNLASPETPPACS